MTSDVAALLADIHARGTRPLAESFALPPEAYRSPELLALEEARIFAQDWLCVGRVDELPRAGDYLSAVIARRPVVVMRGDDGQIRAFSNVCLHRMMRLLEGDGHCSKTFSCPYHAWRYNRMGDLVSAPHMGRTHDFTTEGRRLPQLRVDVWQGWLYLTLNDDAAPLKELLADLAPLCEPYRQEDYISILREEHVWNTNWKLLTENFMESYHLPIVHKSTVGNKFSQKPTTFPLPDADGAFTCQSFEKPDSATYGLAHPDNTRLTGRMRRRSMMPTVFPSHMYVLAPDHLWYLSLLPQGVDKVHIRFGVALAPEVHAHEGARARSIDDLQSFFARVNGEDRHVVERIYENTASPLAVPGPLSWLERELHHFTGYLRRKLCAN